MNAVSVELLETIRELQLLKSFNLFSLGGGTNLAIRYNHRISIDVDMFCPYIIGRAGYNEMVSDIVGYYGDRIYGCDFPCDIDDQYVFLRFFVRKKFSVIKVEVLQNFKLLEEPVIVDGIRLLTEMDIGLLKLMAVANRAGNKDVYDLEYLTERITLIELYNFLKSKQEIFNHPSDKTIFDLDKESSPIDKPELLLKFDVISESHNQFRPIHTHNRISILKGEKTWPQARTNWRRKVRQLYNHLGIPFPDIVGIDI